MSTFLTVAFAVVPEVNVISLVVCTGVVANFNKILFPTVTFGLVSSKLISVTGTEGSAVAKTTPVTK